MGHPGRGRYACELLAQAIDIEPHVQTQKGLGEALSAIPLDLAAKQTDVLDDESHRFALRLIQVRAPLSEDENDTDLLAPIPGLMLVGVVEDDDFTALPTMGSPPHYQLTALRNDQRQMFFFVVVGF